MVVGYWSDCFNSVVIVDSFFYGIVFIVCYLVVCLFCLLVCFDWMRVWVGDLLMIWVICVEWFECCIMMLYIGLFRMVGFVFWYMITCVVGCLDCVLLFLFALIVLLCYSCRMHWRFAWLLTLIAGCVVVCVFVWLICLALDFDLWWFTIFWIGFVWLIAVFWCLLLLLVFGLDFVCWFD